MAKQVPMPGVGGFNAVLDAIRGRGLHVKLHNEEHMKVGTRRRATVSHQELFRSVHVGALVLWGGGWLSYRGAGETMANGRKANIADPATAEIVAEYMHRARVVAYMKKVSG